MQAAKSYFCFFEEGPDNRVQREKHDFLETAWRLCIVVGIVTIYDVVH